MEQTDTVLRHNGTPKSCATRRQHHRHVRRNTQNIFLQGLTRDVDEHTLPEAQGLKVAAIAPQSDLVIGAMVEVLKNGARHALTCYVPQIGNAI